MQAVMNIFTYGPLMIPEVMRRVTGRDFISKPASLRGFVRLLLQGKTYPGIIPFPDAVTDGLVHFDLGRDAVARLDSFQGELYRREVVTVETETGDWVEVQTYVVRRAKRKLLSAEFWDEDDFREQHLKGFLETHEGF